MNELRRMGHGLMMEARPEIVMTKYRFDGGRSPRPADTRFKAETWANCVLIVAPNLQRRYLASVPAALQRLFDRDSNW
jgi:hypothetical protein